MTTNHPDPTPPASPAAVSAPLRPVEEIERDLALASDSSLRGLSNWPWLSIRLIDDIPSLLARLRAAEETLAAVGSAIDRIPRRSGTPEWSTAASVAQASGYDVGLAVASDAVRAALAEGASR